MKWVLYFLLAFFVWGCCDRIFIPSPDYKIKLFVRDSVSTLLDSIISYKYLKDSNFNKPFDSILLRTDPYLFKIDSDSKSEKVVDIDIEFTKNFDYLIKQKNNKWRVKVTNIKVSHHSESKKCDTDYDFIGELYTNDSLYKGPFEIK